MAKPSPSDIQYQLEHLHDNKIPQLLVSQITCFVLAITAVILRLVSRRLNQASIQSDDYMILIALALLMGFFIVGMIAIHNGAGRHVILLQHPVRFIKLVFTVSILYLVGIASVKFSILLLYRRIFRVNQHFNMLSWALGIFILAYTIAGIFIVIFQCKPVHGFWDITINAKCIEFSVPAIILASFNVATDFITLALPMPLIWQMQMSKGRKFQVSGIFLLGGLVCIGSTYRATIIHRMSQPDATWSDVDPGIWAVVEIGIGIVSACLPTLRPIVHWINHGGPYKRRASDNNLQRKSSINGPKRGPFSWLLPSSLQLSQATTDKPTQTKSTEEDETV